VVVAVKRAVHLEVGVPLLRRFLDVALGIGGERVRVRCCSPGLILYSQGPGGLRISVKPRRWGVHGDADEEIDVAVPIDAVVRALGSARRGLAILKICVDGTVEIEVMGGEAWRW